MAKKVKATELELLVQDFVNAKQQKNALDKKLDELSAVIKEKIGDVEEMQVTGYKIIHASRRRTTIDTKQLTHDFPDIAEAYSRITEYKVFEVKAY